VKRINNEKLKLLREKENLTQQEISNILDISVRTYQCYEQGTRTPSLHKAKEIADIFLCSVDDFF
jgi:transcriptional regulator with XRE-family HTH domain